MESKKNNRGKKNPRISGPDKRDVIDSNYTWPIRELEDRVSEWFIAEPKIPL